MTQARSFEYEDEYEDEYELEDETEHEWEDEWEEEVEGEDEDFLGGLANIAGSLLGEGEDEQEDEWEEEWEVEGEDELEDELHSEFEDEDEAFFGGLANIASSLLGEGEDELEDEWEDEAEAEVEAEAEYFFGRIGRFLKKHKNLFKKIAKFAGPAIATAVGGPAAGALARAVTSQLEGEGEAELEAELEEMATAPVTPAQAMGEYLAAQAAATESEAEAEAFIGSAITMGLTRRDRRDLQELLPHLLRGATVLTRILRRHPATRPGVRLVPGIMDSTVRSLARIQAGGRPLRPAEVGAILGRSTRRVLGDPRFQSAVARRHARGLARVRHHRRHQHGVRRPYRGRPVTVHRRPTHTHAVGPRGRVGRPRPGFVRVVTPVRVPPRGGRPARTIRVVSDVKVPRGAVPAGRPASVGGRRRR